MAQPSQLRGGWVVLIQEITVVFSMQCEKYENTCHPMDE
jgi:hypothetical protein